MSSYFRTRKSAYFNIALLFLVVITWILAYMQPVLRSFFKEEHEFYGTVSYAAIPSLFGGTNIPFLDKTYFQLNGDDGATFYLYISREINDEMSEWFSFASMGVGDIPIQVSAVRVSNSRFVVKSISTSEYELDWDMVSEYQLYYTIWGLGVVGVLFLAMIVFVVLGIRCKR